MKKKSKAEKAKTKLNRKPSHRYVIVRTQSAGCFAGYLEKRKGQEAKLLNARRLWYWKGAASLSQLAIDGVKFPNECKFAVPINVELTSAIEIIEVTPVAKAIILAVPAWTA